MKSDAKAISFVEDTAVAPEKLRDYIERFVALVRRHKTTAGVYAHASGGCLHVRPVVNLKTAEGVAKFEAIANEVADLVLEFGGALSGEHGDGLVRGAFNEKMFGSELYQAFRQVKKTFDPNGLSIPAHRRHAARHLASARTASGYATPSPATFFDFSDHAASAARRNVQRRRALPQEARRHDVPVVHGHARRSAFDARASEHVAVGDGRTAWRREAVDKGVHEAWISALVSRCKSECPVGVDVRAIQSEFLSGTGIVTVSRSPLRCLAAAHGAAVWGIRFAPLSNTMANTRIARWAAKNWLGLIAGGRCPQWTRNTLRKHPGRSGPGSWIREVARCVRGHFHRSCRPRDRSCRDRL